MKSSSIPPVTHGEGWQPQHDTFRVVVRDHNPRIMRAGRSAVMLQCGHQHRTTESAEQCLINLSWYPDGTQRPKWAGAKIERCDGTDV